ncbi:GDSL esterase/lipase At3g48460 [Selaginella moellendorffii]|uniref:GDSL esterase/lipase At3g48460 n=1 Tax=Selaginella moellendorffii TaxID=88036 RepID=UPI000D1CAEDD|nr:GDSL esterase/lipase At3g48460 [Selaginella moellendorffii]|eukprot:XP_024521778.1 GDSL esterase/lipase At3g48460 [Selaginella moellendorffii]
MRSMGSMVAAALFLVFFLKFAAAGAARSPWALGGIKQVPTIFQFGDSLSDAGNSLIAFPHTYKRLNTSPYGETFFHHPAGRESDGRLIVDFLAEGYGLPLLDPYLLLSKGRNWRHGVNFAAGGASALPLRFYDQHNISLAGSRHTFPLDIQLRWFQDFQNVSMLRSNQGRRTHPSLHDFSQALYIVGEIGGNDYGFMKKSGLDYPQMMEFVPFVVQAIRDLIQNLYNLGARKFLVTNIPRQGCNPSFLVSRRPSDRLDELGCIADFNALNAHHNSLLREAVDDLRVSLAGASIAHADFYSAIEPILRNPQSYGFTEPRTVCCGTPWLTQVVDCVDGGMINGILTKGQTCADPSVHIYWNGVHFTEHLYNIVANAFLTGQYVDLVANPKLDQ